MNNSHANDSQERSPGSRAESFDTLLNRWAADARDHQATSGLATRIIARAAAVPPDPIELVLSWLRAALWRPFALGSLPFALGFLFAVSVPVSDHDDTALMESLPGLVFTDWSTDRVAADAFTNHLEHSP